MSAHVPKRHWILLGLMTVLTVAGPIAISLVIRGGANRSWPPDRPLEWWTFFAITGTFVVLMLISLWIGVSNWLRLTSNQASSNTKDTPTP